MDSLVYKYELEPGSDIRIKAGPKSRVVATAMQKMPVMWVEHEANFDKAAQKDRPVFDREWEVLLAATGVTVPSGWAYSGLVQLAAITELEDQETGESYYEPAFVVWHVYIRTAAD